MYLLKKIIFGYFNKKKNKSLRYIINVEKRSLKIPINKITIKIKRDSYKILSFKA